MQASSDHGAPGTGNVEEPIRPSADCTWSSFLLIKLKYSMLDKSRSLQTLPRYSDRRLAGSSDQRLGNRNAGEHTSTER